MTEPVLILNVDDTEAIRYAKSRTLKRAGFRVIEAATGSEALALVALHKPALALLDVKLPDMSGLEVCQIVKREHPQVLVLQISATFTRGSDRVKGLSAGADSYLTQPVEPDELVAAIIALLRMRKAEDELRRVNEGLELRVAERTEELAAANRHLRDEIEERNKAEATLRQAQKMEAVGHLTGGIAHDFNNLLMAIMGNLELLQRRLGDDRPDLRPLTDNALMASKRAAALTRRLLSFARRQPLARQSVDVAALMEDLQPVLRTTVGASVEVRADFAAGLWPVLCDRHQLENAVLNLVINARDAMPHGGVVRVSGANVSLDRAEARAAGLAQPGDYVRLAVTDQGEGIPPEVLEKVFEPFYTTKPVGQGTGLGLAMLYSFVRQSGGSVQIDSEVGRGTEVALLLPRMDDSAPAEADMVSAEGLGLGKGETVLLVEDEPMVGGLLCEALAENGYRCVEARDAHEAMAVVAGGARIDLLITDIGLPGGIDGLTLAARLRSRDPHLKVLFISGHADADAAASQNAVLLPKPFDMISLMAQVRQALAE